MLDHLIVSFHPSNRSAFRPSFCAQIVSSFQFLPWVVQDTKFCTSTMMRQKPYFRQKLNRDPIGLAAQRTH